MRVGNIIDERAVPFAEKFTENVAFANALIAEQNGSKLIIATRMKNTGNGGSQDIQSNLVNIGNVICAEKFDEKFFCSGQAIPFG